MTRITTDTPAPAGLTVSDVASDTPLSPTAPAPSGDGEPKSTRGPRIRPDGGGYTPADLARLLRVSPDRVRLWIHNGELPALNTASARCGRPRYVVLPHHLAEFERGRQAAAPKPPARRRRKPPMVDYFPD
jgi:hypothetical protein